MKGTIMGRTVTPKDDETENLSSDGETTKAPLETIFEQIDQLISEDSTEQEAPAEVFLNCKEFKLMGIQQKKDRKYRISFIADSFTGNTETNLRPEIQTETPFERVLKQITALVFPLVFPALEAVTLISLKRNIKNTKHKELKEFFEFKVRTLDGFGYTSQAKEIDVQDLGEQFKTLYNELENLVHEEISKKHAEDPQLSLFGDIEEGDAADEDAE
jgi:hypothetical protein